MNFDKKVLRQYIRDKGITEKELAKRIGIDYTTFSHKMNGKTQWKLNEIQALVEILKIKNYGKVFQII